MKTQTSQFEQHLIGVMRKHGYECRVYATKVKLVQSAIPGFASAVEIPWAFKSVFSAAEHLIPIIREDSYRLAVHAND